MNNIRNKIIVSLALLFLIRHPVYAQKDNIDLTRLKIIKIQAKIDSTVNEQNMLLDSAEVITFKIKSLSGKEQGRKEHKKLEQLLNKSISMRKREEHLNIFLDKLRSELYLLYNKLSDLISARIDSLVFAVEKNSDSDKAVSEELSALLAEKHRIDLALYRKNVKGITPVKIAPNSWDTPSSLRLKSSMLLDRAENLEKQKNELAKLAKNLKQEMKIRQRITELSIDLTLFDENEERTLSQKPLLSGTRALNSELSYDNKNPDLKQITLFEDSPLKLNKLSTSPKSLKKFIKDMENYINKITKIQDSLKTEAHHFNQLAEKRKQNAGK